MQQISSQEPVTISAGTTGDMAFSHARGKIHAKKIHAKNFSSPAFRQLPVASRQLPDSI
jgi:hypothetical protein